MIISRNPYSPLIYTFTAADQCISVINMCAITKPHYLRLQVNPLAQQQNIGQQKLWLSVRRNNQGPEPNNMVC
jgi:hypothetical protein